MRKLVAFLALALAACGGSSNPEVAAWEQRAAGITIIRDDWGIPHVYGKTDADVVFGVMYAQAEDDFNRIETNYLNSIGRLAEAEGEEALWRDLRMKLFIDPDSMRAKYDASPEWLKQLMSAWADGLNYYLHTHPEVKPRVITRFEPWMPLTFSEGSIGNDIDRVNLNGLEAFYGSDSAMRVAAAAGLLAPEPTGSNGIAIGAPMTANGKAMLLINPHTSFFFRAEAQMVSEEGLNAYGALTWGQFFIYQGFNATAGWMHTSGGADRVDEYLETIVRKPEGIFYKYGTEERPLVAKQIVVPFKTDTGMARREFTVYYTHRGPVVRAVDGKWVSVRLMQEPVKALTQSYSRTKAKNFAEYKQIMEELHTNSSNNTLFADAEGNFAYFHANFVPKRDTKFDWSRPVDGSNPATEWQGVHTVDESPLVVSPSNGWVYNTNNWPYTAAGPNSPRQKDFPSYMETNGENARGLHAIRVLTDRKAWTLDSLLAAAYDSYLPAFEPLVPALLKAYDRAAATNPLKGKVSEQVELLRGWDYRWGVESVPTSVAIFWAEELFRTVREDAQKARMPAAEYAATRASAEQHLAALAAASDTLAARFGNWKTAWGEINRFQRLTGDIAHPYSDDGPSIPVGFTSATWGSLASFGARTYNGSKKIYGSSGNSFVAVVEFGDSVRARAVSAGGQSGDPKSKHFNDQAERYATGNLRPVYFYRNQLEGHIEREYKPGK